MGRLFDLESHGNLRRRSDPDEWKFGTLSPLDSTLPETTNLKRRSLVFLEVLTVLLTLGLLVRTAYVALAVPRFHEQALNNHLRTSVTRALRGIVFDAAGTALVTNEDRDDLSLIPADVPKDRIARTELIAQLVKLAGADPLEIDRVLDAYEYTYTPVPIVRRLSPEQKVAILVRFPENADGVIVEKNFSRRYRTSTAMSHILGYVGRITAEEYPKLRESYRPQDVIGKTGIESYYEQTLRGEDGERRISVNAQGQKIATLATSPAVSGCDLTLNLNVSTQEAVQSVLARRLRTGKHSAGAVVVLDPRNGAVRALVSLPTYDNNLFSDGVQGERELSEYDRLMRSPNLPFFDRAISGAYPPGSTFKIVTATAVLENRAVAIDERIESPGLITVASELNPDSIYPYKDWKAEGHGAITIIDAIAESSDTFFYQVTGGYKDLRGKGSIPLADSARRFGFGQTLGIDLSGEVAGTLPTPEWKNRVFTVDRKWFQGDTYNFSIGQGYLLSTPLQVAAATAVVANGGTLYRPQLVSRISGCSDARTILPYAIDTEVADPQILAEVRRGMRLAVTGKLGTAKALQDAPVSVAGKTGTAQFDNNRQEHAWFTLFAPYDHPEVVVTVMVEAGGEGSLTAIPIAEEILEALYPSS